MSYTIHVRVIQADPCSWYSVVEKGVFSAGTWKEVDGEHILSIDNSGTSGTLRFRNPEGDSFVVALGVHNFKRWCDIVLLDHGSDTTAVQIHPTYYSSDAGSRNEMLWKQLACLQRTSCKGLRVKVNYYKEENRTLWATINIS